MDRPEKISFTYEFSRQCNQHCEFCYNAWKMGGEASGEELSTARAKRLLEKVIDETGCNSIALSGGEPLLRKDLYEIIALIKKKGAKVALITNGVLLTEEAVDRCISSGVDLFQVSLLGDRTALHNRLAGIEGFEQVIDAILNIRKRKGEVCTFFVGLSENIEAFKKALELNVLLGVQSVALGRFTPGGAGLKEWERRMPSPEMIDGALEAADEMSRRYRIAVSVSTPVLPCLNDVSKYKNVMFSYCAVGNRKHSLFGIDPQGNLKACSHSPHVIGNLLEKPFDVLVEDRFIADFTQTVPPFCKDCPEVLTCKGGCRSSAHVCYGSFEDEDPYLRLWKARAQKPETSLHCRISTECA